MVQAAIATPESAPQQQRVKAEPAQFMSTPTPTTGSFTKQKSITRAQRRSFDRRLLVSSDDDNHADEKTATDASAVAGARARSKAREENAEKKGQLDWRWPDTMPNPWACHHRDPPTPPYTLAVSLPGSPRGVIFPSPTPSPPLTPRSATSPSAVPGHPRQRPSSARSYASPSMWPQHAVLNSPEAASTRHGTRPASSPRGGVRAPLMRAAPPLTPPPPAKTKHSRHMVALPHDLQVALQYSRSQRVRNQWNSPPTADVEARIRDAKIAGRVYPSEPVRPRLSVYPIR